jgi:beta-phosphoglucomutase family hydrolase
MIQAVIFDMDGVIIDSEPFHYEVNKRIFASLGIEVSEDEYRGYIGVSNTNMWTSIKSKHGLRHSVNELTAMQVNGNIEFMEKERIDPVEGVRELLSALKNEGFRIGLASSSPYKIIEMVLHRFNIGRFFDSVVSGEDFTNGKPAPDIFLHAAKLLGVSAAQCVVIEDAMHGVHAAKAAGMKCIGFANANSPGQDLGRADMVVGDLASIGIGRMRQLAVGK